MQRYILIIIVLVLAAAGISIADINSPNSMSPAAFEELTDAQIFQIAKANLQDMQRDLYKKANDGDTTAMCQIGKMYSRGIGDFDKDLSHAQKWFERAALAGNSEANYELAKSYLRPESANDNLQLIFESLTRASIAGNIKATLLLAYIYSPKDNSNLEDLVLNPHAGLDIDLPALQALKNLDFPPSQSRSEKLLDQAISLLANYPDENCSTIYLHSLFAEHPKMPKGSKMITAQQWKNSAANCYIQKVFAGDFETMYSPAIIDLFDGDRQKMRWLQKAAQNANAHAMSALADIYRWGIGVEKDIQKAIQWYQWATEIRQGDGTDLRNIALLFAKGQGVERDYSKALHWYKRAADAGDDISMKMIGDMFRLGKAVPRDNTKAVEWYKKAVTANKFNSAAIAAAAEIYSASKDDALAMEWYEKAAELGNTKAMMKLVNHYCSKAVFQKGMYDIRKSLQPENAELENEFALNFEKAFQWAKKACGKTNTREAKLYMTWFCLNGYVTEQSDTMAVEYFIKACKDTSPRIGDGIEQLAFDLSRNDYYDHHLMGKKDLFSLIVFAANYQNTEAMRALASVYEGGWTVEKNEKLALKWNQKAALAGDPQAMYKIATYYEIGYAVEADDLKAMDWYRKAAALGHSESMLKIALNYREVEDYAGAFKWFQKGADNGNPLSAFCLAIAYNTGRGVEKDPQAALELYTQAARAGVTAAMHELALMYDKGQDVTQDFSKAFDWFLNAAKQGNHDSMVMIANMYYFGTFLPQDIEQALQWWRRAAENDNSEAMFFIGLVYETGDGVMQDKEKAIDWYKKAANLGEPAARDKLVSIGSS